MQLYPQALNFTASAITQWLIYVRQKVSVTSKKLMKFKNL